MLFWSWYLCHFLSVNRKLNEDEAHQNLKQTAFKNKINKSIKQKLLTPYLYQLVLVCYEKKQR